MRKILDKKGISLLVVLIVLFAIAFVIALVSDEKNSATPIASDLPNEAELNQYDGLVISEIVSNNSGVYINGQNECCDFIEIFNGGKKDINLEGYGLSDASNKIKWAFPNVVIKAGEYIVVNASGKSADGLNSSFKLSSAGGESVALFNKQGKVIDAIETVALSKNQSMIRDGREFKIVYNATPGFENSEKGREAYLSSLQSTEEESLVINEILVKNAGNFKNEDNRFSGFIEIKNISDHTVDLSSCFVSDDENVPFRYCLGTGVLGPNEIIYYYTGDFFGEGKYLGFGFENKNGKVVLSTGGKITQILEYSNLPNGCAYIRDDSGYYYINSSLSAGFENNTSGIESFQKKYYSEPKSLIINEVMTSNNSVLAQNGGHYYDWIELYNNSGKSINLSEYSISLSDNVLGAFNLPNVTLKADEYFVLMCSGDKALTNNDFYHCDFKLGDSESIYLIHGSEIEDSVYVYNVPSECTFGRTEKGWCYSETPTPLLKNTEGYIAISATPSILLGGGIYNDIERLEISIEGQGTIYYTTDGSNPGPESNVYSGPIYLTGSKALKAVSFSDGQLKSNYACESYIINDPHEYPVVCLSIDQNDFDYLVRHWDNKELIYPAYIEIFENDSNYAGYCGVTLQGNTGRRYNRKNFEIKFDGEFGSKNMNYALFEEVNSSSFDSFVLRGGSNASFYVPWKDEFATESAKDLLEVRNYKPCIYYVNGEYMGLYYIREKICAEMISNHYNVDKERVSIARWKGLLEEGPDVWNPIIEWTEEHDLTVKENYEYFCSKVDVEQLCDLWIYQAYFDNPDVSNVRVFSHPDIDNGRIKFIFFDLDLGLYNMVGNYFEEVVFNESGFMHDLANHSYPTIVNLKLLENDEFRKLFQERLDALLSGPLSSENMLELYDKFLEGWEEELVRDREASNELLSEYTRMTAFCRRNLSKREELLRKYAKEVFEVFVERKENGKESN